MKLQLHENPAQPGRLVMQRSPGRSMVAGVVVALVAAAAAAGGLSVLNEPEPFVPYIVVLFALGAVLAVLGLALLVGRVGFDIDVQRATVTAWTSYLSIRRAREYPLADVESIVVTQYWLFNRLARTEEDFYYRLALRTPHSDIFIADGLREADANAVANRLSTYASLSIAREKGRAEGVVSG